MSIRERRQETGDRSYLLRVKKRINGMNLAPL